MTSELQVHVLNAGYGESILLRTPDGRWGVVDCYTRQLEEPEANPTVRFLRDQGVDELAFVCLTHPHDDHFRGLHHLFECFTVNEFWRFGAQNIGLLLGYLKLDALRWKKYREGDRRRKRADLFRQTLEIARQRSGKVTRVSGVNLLDQATVLTGDGPVPFDIRSIAPAGNAADRYDQALQDHVSEDFELRGDLRYQRHNEISIALVVRFGESCIVLGGDVEAAGWREAQEGRTCPPLCATAIKVSHHGSPTGYCDGLWERFASGGGEGPVAVVTPSRKHRLPTLEALQDIGKHAGQVVVTCHAAVPFVTESGTGEGSPPPIYPAVKVFLPGLTRKDDDEMPLGVCSLSFNAAGERRMTLAGAARVLELSDEGCAPAMV